jgi:HEAT repeat protein
LGELYPETLATLLEDPALSVRSQVVLYYIRNRDKIQSLDLEVWLESEFKDVRVALVRLADGLPREEATDVLFDLLLDDEIDVRVEALTMYSRLRLDGFEKMLEMTLQDESIVIQKRAVLNILQLMGDPGRALLENSLKDEGASSPLSLYIKSQLKAPK